MIYTTMQAVPPVLPLLDKETGEVIERSPERHANLVRFQAELEVCLIFFERTKGEANESSSNAWRTQCIYPN
jgi:hypothetical protein